jgi:hypothetical protein
MSAFISNAVVASIVKYACNLCYEGGKDDRNMV